MKVVTSNMGPSRSSNQKYPVQLFDPYTVVAMPVVFVVRIVPFDLVVPVDLVVVAITSSCFTCLSVVPTSPMMMTTATSGALRDENDGSIFFGNPPTYGQADRRVSSFQTEFVCEGSKEQRNIDEVTDQSYSFYSQCLPINCVFRLAAGGPLD